MGEAEDVDGGPAEVPDWMRGPTVRGRSDATPCAAAKCLSARLADERQLPLRTLSARDRGPLPA